MLVQALKQQDVTLKVVTDKIKSQLTDLQSVDYKNTVAKKALSSPLEAVKQPKDKFTITFSYQKQLHRTKVNVAGTDYGTPIYKVALNSRLSEGSRVCWLQNNADGWVTLLGEDMDPKLTKAVISAIENQQ